MKIEIDIPDCVNRLIAGIISVAIVSIFTVGLIFTYKIIFEDLGPCEGNAFMTIIREAS